MNVEIQLTNEYPLARRKRRHRKDIKWILIMLMSLTVLLIGSIISLKGHIAAPVKQAGAMKSKPMNQSVNNPVSSSGLPDGIPAGKMIASLPKTQPTVYLTFDDGPSPYTKEIVNILNQNQIKGSFFWVGNNVKDGQFGKEMIKEGHVIGTHTMKHELLEHKSLQEQTDIIAETTKYISEKIDHPVTYFRPPYGAVDENTMKASIATGQALVYWQVDSEDWKYPHDPKKVLNNIEREVKPGSIILMHEKGTTAKMLPEIINLLRAKGYQFMPLPTKN